MAFIDTNFQGFHKRGALQRASIELSVTTVGGNNPCAITLLANKVDSSLHLQFFILYHFIFFSISELSKCF